MKHWEEAGLLTELLDRHLQRLTEATLASDWTILWTLAPFLGFLRSEAVLVTLVDDYVDQVATVHVARDRDVARILKAARTLFRNHEQPLAEVRNTVTAAKRDGL